MEKGTHSGWMALLEGDGVETGGRNRNMYKWLGPVAHINNRALWDAP